MDRLLNSPLFVKVISLLLAVMLYLSVNMDTPQSQSDKGILPPVTDNEETLLDVELSAIYDEDKYVISGLPQTVAVSLSGQKSTITQAKLQQSYRTFVELEGLEAGTHKVKVQHENFPQKLKVTIEPAYVTVTIHEKVSEVVPVEVELINKSQIEEGYTAEQPIVSPNSVRVTGAKEVVEQMALVKALLDINGAKETITRDAPVKVYDQDGNELQVVVEPSVVEVKVPIVSPFKVVPFKLNRKGELPDDLSINSIEVTPSEVSIMGPKDVLDKIDFVDDVVIDLSEITKDTTLELDIPLPDGVEKVDPEKVKVHIDVEKEMTKSFEEVPIETIGLSEGLSATFVNEDDSQTDITINGTEQVLAELKESDIEVYVDLSNYSKGVHEVDIQVNGPQNITWQLAKNQVTVEIE